MTFCPDGVPSGNAGLNWTLTLCAWTLELCRVGVPHASVLNALVFTVARDFAGGATKALRWTLELCRIDVPHGSVLNVLV